jgi:hypothetical protein
MPGRQSMVSESHPDQEGSGGRGPSGRLGGWYDAGQPFPKSIVDALTILKGRSHQRIEGVVASRISIGASPARGFCGHRPIPSRRLFAGFSKMPLWSISLPVPGCPRVTRVGMAVSGQGQPYYRADPFSQNNDASHFARRCRRNNARQRNS